MPGRIEDYALIGDCGLRRCAKTTDRSAGFAGLGSLGGVLRIAPGNARQWTLEALARGRHSPGRQALSRSDADPGDKFQTHEGAFTLVDFMPLRGKHSHLVRLVQGKRGKVREDGTYVRFDYGRTIPRVTRLEDGTMRAIAGPDMIALRTPAALRGENLTTVSEFTVHEGEMVPFCLSYGASHGPVLPRSCRTGTRTTRSLPAQMGGPLHLSRAAGGGRMPVSHHPQGAHLSPDGRDSAGSHNFPAGSDRTASATGTIASVGCETRLSLCRALMHAGYYHEAEAWQNGFCAPLPAAPRRCRSRTGSPESGTWRSGNAPVDRLPGGSASSRRERRVWSAAAGHLRRTRRRSASGTEGKPPKNEPAIELQRTLLEHLEQVWQEPDEGIWQVRVRNGTSPIPKEWRGWRLIAP